MKGTCTLIASVAAAASTTGLSSSFPTSGDTGYRSNSFSVRLVKERRCSISKSPSGTEAKPDTPLIAKAVEMVADDSLLNLEIENQRSDYDWLTPDVHDLAANTTDILKDERISQKLEVTNSCANSTSSSSRDRKANSRASTPTRRPSLPAKPKSSCFHTYIKSHIRALSDFLKGHVNFF